MTIILNEKQREIVDKAKEFYKNSSEQVFQYSGSAGTGKSVVLDSIITELGIKRDRVAPMSYIGAAAIVMRLKGLTNAKTIHSWLFHPTNSLSTTSYNEYLNRPETVLEFVPKALNNIELIVIDEAGAVPLNLKNAIESRGIKIIACGDLDQLPPVADTPAYLYDRGKVHVLDTIMRQNEHSGIVYLSQRAKLGQSIDVGTYGEAVVIYEDELNNETLVESDMVICGKNATRDSLNKYIRNDIYGFTSQLPGFGEKIVCRKNNWNVELDGISLANGLTGTVQNFTDISRFDGKNFIIDFKPSLFDSVFKSVKCDYGYFSAEYDLRDKLKYNKYNTSNKFELAYAISTHMSQGSQYRQGVYIEEYLNPNINNNLNYTGITRFSNGLVYVKKRKKYY